MSVTPTINRAVDYRSFGTPGGEFTPKCRAATITEVGAWVDVPGSVSDETVRDDGLKHRTIEQRWEPDACALTVENPTGTYYNTCSHDESGAKGGTWHWPCTPRTDT